MPRAMLFRKVSKKVKTAVKRCHPSKKTVSILSDGIEATVRVSDVVANATSFTPFQTATGLALELIECCKKMKDNKKKSRSLAEAAQKLLDILQQVKESEMNDAVRNALNFLVGTLHGIKEDMDNVTKCGKFGKIIRIKGDTDKIQDCTTRLLTICGVFQAAVSTVNHVGMIAEQAHLNRIEQNTEIIIATVNHAETMRQHSAKQGHLDLIEQNTAIIIASYDRMETALQSISADIRLQPSSDGNIVLQVGDVIRKPFPTTCCIRVMAPSDPFFFFCALSESGWSPIMVISDLEIDISNRTS